MRHRLKGNQLGRPTNQAKALYKSLITELLEHGRIETTLAKAKAVVGLVDKLINSAKKNTVSARREVAKTLTNKPIIDKLFVEIAPGYPNRSSGYTRVMRLSRRFSDTAEMVLLELVEKVAITKPEAPAKTAKKTPRKTTPKTTKTGKKSKTK